MKKWEKTIPIVGIQEEPQVVLVDVLGNMLSVGLDQVLVGP